MIIDGGHTLGRWIEPARARAVAPRVSIEQKLAGMKNDLNTIGIAYDESEQINTEWPVILVGANSL